MQWKRTLHTDSLQENTGLTKYYEALGSLQPQQEFINLAFLRCILAFSTLLCTTAPHPGAQQGLLVTSSTSVSCIGCESWAEQRRGEEGAGMFEIGSTAHSHAVAIQAHDGLSDGLLHA